MIKFISGVVLGVFVGAVAVEIFERRPELIDAIKAKARGVGDRVRDTAARVEDAVRRSTTREAGQGY